jgi:hypothetical protein
MTNVCRDRLGAPEEEEEEAALENMSDNDLFSIMHEDSSDDELLPAVIYMPARR